MSNSDLIQLVSPIGAEAICICALLPLRDRERGLSDGLTKLYPTQLEALTQLRVRSSGMARGAMPGSLECRTEGQHRQRHPRPPAPSHPSTPPQYAPHRYSFRNSCTGTAALLRAMSSQRIPTPGRGPRRAAPLVFVNHGRGLTCNYCNDLEPRMNNRDGFVLIRV